jgi:hypothetical protein
MSKSPNPKFKVRRNAANLDYCVIVEWPNSEFDRVNFFPGPAEAQQWIDREADNWLRLRPFKTSQNGFAPDNLTFPHHP